MSSQSPSLSSSEEIKAVLSKAVDLCVNFIVESNDRSPDTRVVNFASPDALRAQLDLALPEAGVGLNPGLEGLVDSIEKVMKHSVKTGHPRFFNQLWAGTDLAGIIGEWLTAVIHSSTYTFELAPVFSLMEIEIVNRLLDVVGWTGGDGAFNPGGSFNNLISVLTARNTRWPESKEKGWMALPSPLAIFTSTNSHYSIKRAANVLGLGTACVHEVDVDAEGCMDMADLRKCIEAARINGFTPFFVNATAGTTVLGAFDPFKEIRNICDEYNMWMHVDGAWGGSIFLSTKHKKLLQDANLADSITWCTHKMMGIPLLATVILTKEKGLLSASNASHAKYLFHDGPEKAYDLGDKTLSCGRRQDALKVWLSWKAQGKLGFEAKIDKQFDNMTFLVNEMKKRGPYYQILWKPQSLALAFWCVPPSLQSMSEGSERNAKLGEITPKLRRLVQEDGRMLLNFQPIKGTGRKDIPPFFRFVLANPETTTDDLLWCLDNLESLAKEF